MQLPDVSQFLKLGFTGAVLLAAYLALMIAYKVVSATVVGSKNGNPRPRELTAGEKDPSYWEHVFGDINDDGCKKLLAQMEKDHRAVVELLGKIRARVRDFDNSTHALAEIKEFREQYRQDMISLVRLLRELESKLDGK